MRASLHVTEEPDASTDEPAGPRTSLSAGKQRLSTVGQLIRQLKDYPPQTPVALSYVSGSSISLAEERDTAGEIVFLVLSASE